MHRDFNEIVFCQLAQPCHINLKTNRMKMFFSLFLGSAGKTAKKYSFSSIDKKEEIIIINTTLAHTLFWCFAPFCRSHKQKQMSKCVSFD